MEPTFPLLQLPENAIITVLKNLGLGQLFIISLVSSKTKNLVTSLGLRADCVGIIITSIISISVDVGRDRFHLTIFNNSNDENGELPADITLPVSANFYFEDTKMQLTTQLFNFSNWLNHVQAMFCWIKPPNVYFGRGCEIFKVQSLKDAIGDVNDLYVSGRLTDVMSREVLKQFNTPNILYLNKNPFEDVSEIQKFFIQNRKTIIFDDVYSLDDMLLVNSKRAELSHPISQKQFNQFLKQWIRGSNPRLQDMSLSIHKIDFDSGEVYLNGIRCTTMEEVAKQEIIENHRLPIADMAQIRRNDGTTAVVVTKDSENVLFDFSLISTKTKNLVTSLGLRSISVEIKLCRVIRIFVCFENARFQFIIYNFSNDLDGELPADIALPVGAAFFGWPGPIIQLTTPLLNFNNWLNHIRTVFCYTLPPCISFSRGSERFNIGLLKDAIGSVNLLLVLEQSTYIQYKNILSHFNTPSRLFLVRNPFEEVSEIQKFFIQNFQSFAFHDVYSLDDMLLVNSEKIKFTCPISQKQFNQFVKHWIRGSNPRLQCMSLSIDKIDFPSGAVYLKGIQCMEMNEESKQEIRENHSLSVNVDMVQVRRRDGTPAVVVTKDSEHVLYVHFIVLY
ncbi:hypothetical protein GCK72_008568 [Caenorhabditis remanei]|uniref:F-box domain-containing protein n=1 Tax=Caenorhabditis remanei TaxID=31234 RepID=A0A6A5GXW3_CAERE|nr:hypothetical protein GCK72_008568 [Caenorhabditis remanei]KAF1760320.1 hypothetical protein GCK72_008568 [Caenorhabditis remanei]